MILRDRGVKPLKSLLLFSGDSSSQSWINLGSGAYGLSQMLMEWVWSTSLDWQSQRDDWRASPLSGELRNLPPVQQIIGSLDPLLDDAYALKARLDASQSFQSLECLRRVNHGFVRYNSMIATAAGT